MCADRNTEKDTVDDEKQSKAVRPDYRQRVEVNYDYPRRYIGRLFWGLLFVLVGALALMGQLGWIQVNFINIWRLWPLFIIAAGLSLVASRSSFGRIIMAIFAIFVLASVAWIAVMPPLRPNHTQNLTVNPMSQSVKQVDISVNGGATDLIVNAKSQKALVSSKFESSGSKIDETSSLADGTQNINLNMKFEDDWMFTGKANVWAINLSETTPVSLSINTGASKADIDLTNVKLNNLNLKFGASNVTASVGSKQDLANVNVESGVSTVIIRVPSSSGVKVSVQNGLTTNNLDGLNRVSEGVYESSNYASATKKVNITTKIGVSSFTLKRY